MLWRIIHKRIPEGSIVSAPDAKTAIKHVRVGLFEPSKFRGMKAVPLTLEDIEEYLTRHSEISRKHREEHPEQYANRDGTPATGPDGTDPDEVGGMIIPGLEF